MVWEKRKPCFISFQRDHYSLKKNPRIHRVWKRLEAALETPCPWCWQVGKQGLSTNVEMQFQFREALCPQACPPVSQTYVHGECHGSPQLLYHLLPAEDLGLSSQRRGKCEGFQCFFVMMERLWDQWNSIYLLCRADAEHWQSEPLLLLKLWFVAIGSYHVYLSVPGESSTSESPCRGGSWPGPPTPAPAGALQLPKMLRCEQSWSSGASQVPMDSWCDWHAVLARSRPPS